MCCCCPSAIQALLCLWIQSGFSKGTVAGALTFFPPDPPLYEFSRMDRDGNELPQENDDDSDDESAKQDQGIQTNGSGVSNESVEVITDGNYQAREGQTKEKVRSPAQEFTHQAKVLKKRGQKRNVRDTRDAKNGVTYKLVLDSRLQPPRFRNGGSVEAVKIPTGKKSSDKPKSHCAAIVCKVPDNIRKQTSDGTKTRTLIFSHGNATDIGAMHPLQLILSNSLECNVVSYDYSGYGESGGVAMEANTYSDIKGVYQWTLENVCDGDPSRIILYGQSVGSGPCCYLAKDIEGLGGMVLHSPFMSGMRVLTPSRALACLDIFPNINRVKKTKCPVMVIHGKMDEEVPIDQGIGMYEATPDHFKRDPWWVPDRGHNDITEGPGKLAEYVGRLRSFMQSLD